MEKRERDSSIKDLSSKLDQILNRLDFLEKVILDKPQYSGLAISLQMARATIGMYGEPLKIAARVKSAEKIMSQKAIAQDDISRCIVQAVALKGALNISAITREVCNMRGKASRRIVRERVLKLERLGHLIKIPGQVPIYKIVEKEGADVGGRLGTDKGGTMEKTSQ